MFMNNLSKYMNEKKSEIGLEENMNPQEAID
jgi:hypothetical protein